ncbi:MAG: pilus assembly protein [Planctomycetota bacterium]|jgi:Flp pilus assembly pilin Flp
MAGRRRKGQSLVEYALILVLVLLVVVVALTTFGEQVADTTSDISNAIGNVT